MKELLRDLVALPGCGAFEQPVGGTSQSGQAAGPTACRPTAWAM